MQLKKIEEAFISSNLIVSFYSHSKKIYEFLFIDFFKISIKVLNRLSIDSHWISKIVLKNLAQVIKLTNFTIY